MIQTVLSKLHGFLAQQQFLLLFLVVGLGCLLGRVKIKGFGLGTTAATIVLGIVVSSVAYLNGVKIEYPDILSNIFFYLFIFAVGLRIGPQFWFGVKQAGVKFIVLGLIASVLGPHPRLHLGQAVPPLRRNDGRPPRRRDDEYADPRRRAVGARVRRRQGPRDEHAKRGGRSLDGVRHHLRVRNGELPLVPKVRAEDLREEPRASGARSRQADRRRSACAGNPGGADARVCSGGGARVPRRERGSARPSPLDAAPEVPARRHPQGRARRESSSLRRTIWC